MRESNIPTVRVDVLSDHLNEFVTLQGWVYNRRSSKKHQFIELRDGSGQVQCVVSKEDVRDGVWESSTLLKQESSLRLTGRTVADDRSPDGVEIHVSDIEIIQISEAYPISHKEHGVEFLMENRHLWLRSQRQWAIMRIRDRILFSIQEFFQKNGFLRMDAPIFTPNAAEGTTTLFETDYFDESAYLTQSGQLYGEAMAMAHGRIYTFGPTFRAEKSQTRRHLTEFWMVEPEMAFVDLEEDMIWAERLLQWVVQSVLKHHRKELDIIGRDLSTLEPIPDQSFKRLHYDAAVELLTGPETDSLLNKMAEDRDNERFELNEELKSLKKTVGTAKKWKRATIEQRIREINDRLEQIEEDFRNLPVWRDSARTFEWGKDFGGSDETLLTMQFDTPLIVHHYPAAVKAFYMKRDPERDDLALAMDLLAPEGYGEIVGGSEREDDLKRLKQRIREHGLPEDRFEWYLDLRQFGSVPHSGFGLGIERTVAWICGLPHVRETIPFPRMPGRLTP
ncbi:MAG: asparagine--tRNA ligase [Bacteroidota bacterium]